jgi:hypothetical protein
MTFEANNYKKVICEPKYSHFKSKACACPLALGRQNLDIFAALEPQLMLEMSFFVKK